MMRAPIVLLVLCGLLALPACGRKRSRCEQATDRALSLTEQGFATIAGASGDAGVTTRKMSTEILAEMKRDRAELVGKCVKNVKDREIDCMLRASSFDELKGCRATR